MNLGIIGLGVVGRAVHSYYAARFDMWTYDIATDEPDALTSLNKQADVVFVCVPTPSSDTGVLDCSQVESSVDALTGEKVVIIKSTLNPGTTDQLQKQYPQHAIFHVPEFLSEDTAEADYAKPHRPVLVGLPADSANRGIDVMQKLHPFASVCGASDVEIIKLATNTFYALKVAFANALYDIGLSQQALNMLGEDPWIGGEHFALFHKGYRGYGGKCLPKDSIALRAYAKGSSPALLDLIDVITDYNRELRNGSA